MSGLKYWKSLNHNGVLVCDPYVPQKIHVTSNKTGQKYILNPIAEEIFSILKSKKNYKTLLNDKIFYTNLKRSLNKYLPSDLKKVHLYDIDISKLHAYKPSYNTKLENEHIIINDIEYKSSHSIFIEPPSIFIGRGEHPLRGTYKHRVDKSDITLNISRNNFEKLKKKGFNVIENPHVLWYVSYKDSLKNDMKYIFLPKTFYSHDHSKFELARKLKKKLPFILSKNKVNLQSINPKLKQCAIALYLIYLLCIRVGNEKDSNSESETFGCCSLKKTHITFYTGYKIFLNFQGKDSILFSKKVCIDKDYYYGLKTLCANIQNTSQIFNMINPIILNKYMNSIMPSLTAKVFRTMRASTLFQKKLNASRNFKDANAAVAALCNHTTCTTSKNNYIDPRIIVSFSHKNNIPITNFMSKELITKYEWAMKETSDFVF